MENAEEITIVRMRDEHIDAVYEVECGSFHTPWSKKSLREELSNSTAYYYVALGEADKMLGYGGLWHIVNEGHIVNIAVRPELRRKGIGRAILQRLIQTAVELGMIGLTLEVNINNEPAQRLYTSMGFKPEGLRRRYYSDTGEDAVIMWKYFY